MAAPGMGLQQTTDYKVVLPFYAYASIAFLVATILLLFNTELTKMNHFNPPTLAITHTMALGWGTMMIFGASYQLLPVLIEGKLSSNFLGYLTFIFAGFGIPILIYGFYHFDPVDSLWLLTGAILVNIGVVCYLINVIWSAFKSDKKSIHSWFVIMASIWLFTTTFFGLLLLINFSTPILTLNSLSYLTLHAHFGLIGWFLMLIFGVGSRLIPLFLISKYENDKQLWEVFVLTNLCLIGFIVIRLMNLSDLWYYLPIVLGLAAVAFFGHYCYMAHKVRIRKKVDNQVKTSLLSVGFMVLPILALIAILSVLPGANRPNIPILYGYFIFFGWITAIILGMTFKTLPFIVWNKVYDKKKRARKTLAPKDLFSEKIYKFTVLVYLTGFICFGIGILISISLVLKIGAALLVAAAILYDYNVFKTLLHKSE